MSMITKNDAYALFENDVVREIMEGATKQSKVLQLFRKLPNMTSDKTKMRVLDALPMAYWVDEATNNGRKNYSKQAWENKYITAEELAVIIPIKEDVLNDADYDIWADVKPRLAEAIGKAIDNAVVCGVNKPASFRADLLSSIVNAGALIEPSDGQTLYSQINDAMAKVEDSGYNPSALLGGVGLKSKFRMLLDTTGQPITGTEIGELPRFFLDNGAWDKTKADMIVGDFSQAVYAIRQDITYKILTEAVIQNPSTGDILYNLAQDDMVALRVCFRFGWEIPNPVNALNETATRFPFAAIKGSSGVTTQNVTVTVTDSSSSAVADAKVIFGGMEAKTNSSGVATFKAQAGKYEYTVKKGGKVVNGTSTVASSSVAIAVTNF